MDFNQDIGKDLPENEFSLEQRMILPAVDHSTDNISKPAPRLSPLKNFFAALAIAAGIFTANITEAPISESVFAAPKPKPAHSQRAGNHPVKKEHGPMYIKYGPTESGGDLIDKLLETTALPGKARMEYVLDFKKGTGFVTIYGPDGKVMAKAPALSGMKGKNGKGNFMTAENSWTSGKGPIPPSSEIKGNYYMRTCPWATAGDENRGEHSAMGPHKYWIFSLRKSAEEDISKRKSYKPNEVYRKNGVKGKASNNFMRSGELLHQDFDPKRELGTHGCIGVTKSEDDKYWAPIETALKELNDAGYYMIPVTVMYKGMNSKGMNKEGLHPKNNKSTNSGHPASHPTASHKTYSTKKPATAKPDARPAAKPALRPAAKHIARPAAKSIPKPVSIDSLLGIYTREKPLEFSNINRKTLDTFSRDYSLSRYKVNKYYPVRNFRKNIITGTKSKDPPKYRKLTPKYKKATSVVYGGDFVAGRTKNFNFSQMVKQGVISPPSFEANFLGGPRHVARDDVDFLAGIKYMWHEKIYGLLNDEKRNYTASTKSSLKILEKRFNSKAGHSKKTNIRDYKNNEIAQGAKIFHLVCAGYVSELDAEMKKARAKGDYKLLNDDIELKKAIITVDKMFSPNMLLAYNIHEITPAGCNPVYRIHFIDRLLREGGTVMLEGCPALNDNELSFGPFQLVERYALAPVYNLSKEYLPEKFRAKKSLLDYSGIEDHIKGGALLAFSRWRELIRVLRNTGLLKEFNKQFCDYHPNTKTIKYGVARTDLGLKVLVSGITGANHFAPGYAQQAVLDYLRDNRNKDGTLTENAVANMFVDIKPYLLKQSYNTKRYYVETSETCLQLERMDSAYAMKQYRAEMQRKQQNRNKDSKKK